jgi:hypothetical protein
MTREDLAKRARKYQQAEEKRKSGQSIITKLLQLQKHYYIEDSEKQNGNRYTDEHLLERNRASKKILALSVYIRIL